MKDDKLWLIWSVEHNAWWKANECGYTVNHADAGKYTIEQAHLICSSANKYSWDTPNETMVRVDDE